MEEERREVEHFMLFGTADTPLDHTGRVTEHITCRACGYDLVGMQNGKQCPECGAPVGISIYGDLLSHSPAEWTEQVGQHVRIGGLLLMALPVVLAIGIGIAIHGARPVSGLLPSIILAGWCYAVVQSVRREPVHAEATREQRFVRYAALALGLIVMVGFVAESVKITVAGPVVFFFASVAFMVVFTLYTRWLSNLILRVPSPDLCHSLDQKLWVILALGVLVTALIMMQTMLGIFFFGFFLVAPILAGYVLVMGYTCVQAGEMMLCESRLAREKWLEREALLEKEQRFERVVGAAPGTEMKEHAEA